MAHSDPEESATRGPSDSGGHPVPDGYLDLGALFVPRIPGLQLRGKFEADKETLHQVLLVLGASGVAVSVAAAPKSGGSWPGLAAQIEASVEAAGGEAEEVSGPYGLEIHAKLAQLTPNGKTVLMPMRILGVEGPRWVARLDIQGPAAAGDAEQLEAVEDLIDRLIVNRGESARIKHDLLPLRLPKEAADPTSGQADS